MRPRRRPVRHHPEQRFRRSRGDGPGSAATHARDRTCLRHAPAGSQQPGAGQLRGSHRAVRHRVAVAAHRHRRPVLGDFAKRRHDGRHVVTWARAGHRLFAHGVHRQRGGPDGGRNRRVPDRRPAHRRDPAVPRVDPRARAPGGDGAPGDRARQAGHRVLRWPLGTGGAARGRAHRRHLRQRRGNDGFSARHRRRAGRHVRDPARHRPHADRPQARCRPPRVGDDDDGRRWRTGRRPAVSPRDNRHAADIRRLRTAAGQGHCGRHVATDRSDPDGDECEHLWCGLARIAGRPAP